VAERELCIKILILDWIIRKVAIHNFHSASIPSGSHNNLTEGNLINNLPIGEQGEGRNATTNCNLPSKKFSFLGQVIKKSEADMNYQSIKNLKDQVEWTLENYEETRNSDITLMIQIWKCFYNSKIIGSGMIRVSDLYELPREDNIKRIRAKIQNDPIKPRFLPTDLKIALQRGMNEEEWLKAMGYWTKANYEAGIKANQKTTQNKLFNIGGSL